MTLLEALAVMIPINFIIVFAMLMVIIHMIGKDR